VPQIKKRYWFLLVLIIGFLALFFVGRNSRLLFAAVDKQDLPEIERLLKKGANPNIKRARTKWWEYGDYNTQCETPLHCANTYDKLPMLKKLLEYKADPNIYTPNNCTPLRTGLVNMEVTKALIEAGADPNVKCKFHIADLRPIGMFVTSFEQFEYLIAHGLDVHAVDSDSGTFIHRFAAWPIAVKLLIKMGLDPNAKPIGETYETPLCEAVSSSAVESVELLLKNGASPFLECYAGNIPVDKIIYRREFSSDDKEKMARYDTIEKLLRDAMEKELAGKK